jgi:bla regulator protein blaR1
MAQFVSLLPRFVDRIVTDSTGLTGRFDMELNWTPLPGEWVAPPSPGVQRGLPTADGPSLFTAVQEQLGLKLRAQTGPVDTLVIDSVEKSSEN